MANSEECTLYDRKNQTNAYDFLRIKRVHALDSSVSFKSTFVDIASVIDLIFLLQFSYCYGRAINLVFFTRLKHYDFFKSVSKHYEFFHSV